MADGIQISALPVALVLSGAELLPIVLKGTISAITKAANAVITISDMTGVNPFAIAQQAYIAGVGGMGQINGLGASILGVGGTSGAWTITMPINSSGFDTYTVGGFITTTVSVPLRQALLAAGLYDPTFQSGNLQYTGPGGTLAANNDMIYGKIIPNPSGVPGPCLLLGSGIEVSFWIIQDQAFTTAQHGNDLGITAGEVQPGSSQRGGNLLDFAGGADLGQGGLRQIQGGTSLNGLAGLTVVQGANSTNQLHPAGDSFVIAGQVGSVGATVHLIMTQTNGVSGVIRHRVNSTIIWDEFADGSWFFYGVGGGTYGDNGAPIISRGVGNPIGPAQPSECTDHVEVINGKTFTWVKGLLKSVV